MAESRFESFCRSEAFTKWLETPEGGRTMGPWAHSTGLARGTSAQTSCHRAWVERAAREVIFLDVLGKLGGALEGAGIPAWILKGPSLAYRLYDSPLHRSYTDLDILVSEHRWKDFERALMGLGAVAEPGGGWVGTKFRRVFQLGGVTVEGHRQMLVGRDLEGISRWHSYPSSVPGMGWFREFETNLLFVYLCGHGAFQHLFDQLQWLWDLDRLARRETLDAAAIERLAIRLRLRRAVAVSARVLRRQFATPLPEGLESAGPAAALLGSVLSRALTPERLVRHAHRSPRPLYLALKACLRDHVGETLAYGLSRLAADEGDARG